MLFLKIFQVILIDFVTKNKKEYKEYNFGIQRVHPLFVLDVCTLLLFFVLEKSGHPATISTRQTCQWKYKKPPNTSFLRFFGAERGSSQSFMTDSMFRSRITHSGQI
jgi:hypothetical protein